MAQTEKLKSCNAWKRKKESRGICVFMCVCVCWCVRGIKGLSLRRKQEVKSS